MADTRNPVIGLLGGGQLGRMLCEAANPLGIDIAILDEENSPAKQAHSTGRHVTGSFKDPARIRELAAQSDVLSVEIEHVDTEVLEDIAENGVEMKQADGSTKIHKPAVHPSWKTIRLIQDKFLQKEHFRNSGRDIAVADQMAIESEPATLDSLKNAAAKFGFPFMLKARKGSYDGRGNYKINSEKDFEDAVKALGGLSLYAEKWAVFEKELAVMVIRTEDDNGNLKKCIAFPPVETVHEDSICTRTNLPPQNIPEYMCEQASRLAIEAVSTLWGRGVFAVEMFLLKEEWTLVVNEVAPRPHNSGHYTIEAFPYMSQYKAQIYSVLDLNIPTQLTPRVNCAIMLNILGGATPTSHLKLVERARNFPYFKDMDLYLHLYNKAAKPGRKIGHITITGTGKVTIWDLEENAKQLIDMVNQIRQERITAPPPEIVLGQPKPTLKQSKEETPLVLVTMGSDSDLPVLKAGLDILRDFGVPYALDITSAHRTPKYMMKVADEAAGRGIKVIIAAAGGAAHLPGMLSSETPLPVIGVPVKATHLDGMDSLLSIVQMPRGVPTATVGINNSTNAALLAIRILGSFMPEYQDKMKKYQFEMEEQVIFKGTALKELGAAEYLAAKGK
ncbi:hypothetical protein N0V88_004187 [Collariella sp. IMI 366227]|nr:hypothetical protein N0V88_004187 [Collariella sp. IMI 366227]